MAAEIPYFKNCCFYIPLRHGLLVWGYLSALLALVVGGSGICDFIRKSSDSGYYSYVPPRTCANYITFITTTLIVSAADLVFSGILLVAGHKTNYKLFNIYYKYAVIRILIYLGMIIMILIARVSGLFFMSGFVNSSFNPALLILLSENPALGFIDILLQSYIVLLLRSYMLKLQDNKGEFKPLENGILQLEDDDESKPEQKIIIIKGVISVHKAYNGVTGA